jgi:hypothetical protein
MTCVCSSFCTHHVAAALLLAVRYYETRIYDDAHDVDALCSFACFLQVVRKQHERAALMYSCALQVNPQRARGISLLLAAEIRTPMDFELFHATIFEVCVVCGVVWWWWCVCVCVCV